LDTTYFNDLIRLILPSEIFDYFEIIRLDIQDKEVHIYLDERNIMGQQKIMVD